MSIGSNVLEMELCAPIAYFALGRAVRLLNDKDAVEEYVGAFSDGENPAETGEPEDGMEGAPAAKGNL